MPWGRLDDSLYDHPKLDRLAPERRLEGIGLWAVSISWSNRYLTDGHVPRRQVERLGGTLALADELVAAGLFDTAEADYLVHDFHDFNDTKKDVLERREKEAQRKAEWRKKGLSQRDIGSRPSGTNGTAPHDVPPGQAKSDDVPPGHTAGHVSRRDSRYARVARDVARIPTRPDPTRPSESLERDSARSGAKTQRADVQALLDRGWKRVTKAQRKVLDEILARHDVTGAEFAAEVIRSTAPDRDPLAEVIAVDTAWQEHERRRVKADEEAWNATKAQERVDAQREAPPWLVERLAAEGDA